IGVWQQDRWSNGGAHGLVAGYTFDAGATWARTPQPFSACAPGGLKYERASDPWVSFGPDGTAYSVSISFNQSNNANAVGASVSTDGGQTWSNPAVLIANDEPTTQFFNDKESVTANPVKAGTAYDDPTGTRLKLADDSPASALDGPPKFAVDGPLTPDGYGVNTMAPPYQPSYVPPPDPGNAAYADPADHRVMPPQGYATIGDRLSEKNIDWAWYSGAW
ncbi:alkaline phosphatase family protein, partial [Burkholderia sola]|uniref:alkaline phosphatase family protein n=1 Tax=Burkholderia sola TaxID=2843302 RepID=UPI0023DD6F2F